MLETVTAKCCRQRIHVLECPVSRWAMFNCRPRLHFPVPTHSHPTWAPCSGWGKPALGRRFPLVDRQWFLVFFLFLPVYYPAVCAGLDCHSLVVWEFSAFASSFAFQVAARPIQKLPSVRQEKNPWGAILLDGIPALFIATAPLFGKMQPYLLQCTDLTV